MNQEITDAFVSLQESFYKSPSTALSPWISVDEDTGQYIITHLNSILNNSVIQGKYLEYPFRDNIVGSSLKNLIPLHPWNLIFEYLEDQNSYRIYNSESFEELRKLGDTINSYHRAI